MTALYTDRLNGLNGDLAVKAPCRVATTANITLSGTQTIDGVAVVADDRVLVKDQTSSVDNGIWIVGSGAWTRALDFNGSRDCVGGTMVLVVQGSANSNSYWRVDGIGAKAPATDAITFSAAFVDDSATATFLPYGTGAVATTVQEELRRQVRTVLQRGATGDGVADDTAECQAALNLGGIVRFSGPATYKLTDRLLVTQPGTVILIDANTTLSIDAWTYPGSQTPFGNSIHITAANCSVIGSGPSSVIQNTGGSDANGIGFLHIGGGYVANLTLDGAKSGVTAIADDTFQSGISIINTTGGSASGATSDVVVENCVIRNWTQYGANIYGDLTKNIRISNCHIYDNGNAGQADSVGAGIVLTRANKRITVTGCSIHGNKNKGIFQSSAGENAGEMVFSNNLIYSNGSHGISCTEESAFGSISGAGTDGVTITGNTIYSNTGHGILLGTFDSVGFLKNVTVTGNVVKGNGSYGIIVFTNNHATDRTSNAAINDNILTGNTDYGLGIAANNTTIFASGNAILGNTAGQITNSGSGATTVVDNITDATTAAFLEGSFTGTLTGCTTSPTGSVGYTLRNGLVTLSVPTISATSNTTAATITGMPATIRPSAQRSATGVATDNGVDAVSWFDIETSGTITLRFGVTATFTNSGTKGVKQCSLSYRI